MSNDGELLIIPVPSLIAVLLNKEKEKGNPLTEDEVNTIRDGCACIAMRKAEYLKVCESRGYDDIDPEKAWEEWRKIRSSLHAV